MTDDTPDRPTLREAALLDAANDVRATHQPNEWDSCVACRKDWPCDAELLAELVVTRATLATPANPAGLREAAADALTFIEQCYWEDDDEKALIEELTSDLRAALAADEPGLADHGRCCECFDGPNFAGGHEHWGDEV